MFFNVKLPWNHLASILLTPDNRMMYSLYQYALGKDSIEIEVNSFLFWLIPLWAVSFWDSYAKILEGWYRREHIHSTMQIHTCRAGDAHSTSPRSGAKIGIPLFFLFFFKSLERFPSLGRSTQSQCAELSQKTGVRALRHYDDMTQGTTLSLETGTQRDSCQRLEPVYQWLAETQGPPRHAHMHIISLSLE